MEKEHFFVARNPYIRHDVFISIMDKMVQLTMHPRMVSEGASAEASMKPNTGYP
jgi:hypothetical protein